MGNQTPDGKDYIFLNDVELAQEIHRINNSDMPLSHKNARREDLATRLAAIITVREEIRQQANRYSEDKELARRCWSMAEWYGPNLGMRYPKVLAIKLYRQLWADLHPRNEYGQPVAVGLKDAKDAIDNYLEWSRRG